MADNKQYITQAQENGAVMISEEVVATIAAHAVTEVEGVVSVGTKITDKKNWVKGMKIVIGENNEMTIDCNVVIAYGQTVVTVAKAAQEAILSAVESMTGVAPKAVNVNVSGIARQ